MKSLLLLLIAAALVMGACSANASPAKITLKPSVMVHPEGMVNLSDIASIKGTPAQVKSLSEAVITIAPKPGKSKTVSAEYIQRKLDSVRLGNVELQGSSESIMEGECLRIGSEQMLEEATGFLQSLLPELSRGVYNISVVTQAGEVVTQTGSSVQIQPRLLFSEPRIGNNYILLDIRVDGKIAATPRVQLKAAVMVEALTATSTIRKGDPVGTGNCALRQVELVNGREYLGPDDLDTTEPLVSNRTLMPGTVICSGDVVTPPAVKKGDSVTLLVRCGNVRLATLAEAKESGRRGESVSVRSDISSADVKARILEPGLVEITR